MDGGRRAQSDGEGPAPLAGIPAIGRLAELAYAMDLTLE